MWTPFFACRPWTGSQHALPAGGGVYTAGSSLRSPDLRCLFGSSALCSGTQRQVPHQFPETSSNVQARQGLTFQMSHFFGWDYLAEPHIRVFISIVLIIMTRQMMGGLRNLVLLNVQALNRLPWPWNGTLRCRNSILSIVINSLMEGRSFIQQAFPAWVLCQAGL